MYAGRFGADAEVLHKRETERAAYVVDHGDAATVWPYVRTDTVFAFSDGVPTRVVQERSVPTFRDGVAKEMTRTVELGRDASTAGGGQFWGDVPNYTVIDVQRRDERTIDLGN